MIYPSESVIVICEETEKCFQRLHATVGDKLPQSRNFLKTVCSLVLSEVGMIAFKSLDFHMYDSTPDNNHIFNLIKCVAHSYATIRLHHLAKQKTVVVSGINIRKDLTKLILFKGQ